MSKTCRANSRLKKGRMGGCAPREALAHTCLNVRLNVRNRARGRACSREGARNRTGEPQNKRRPRKLFKEGKEKKQNPSLRLRRQQSACKSARADAVLIDGRASR
eukprot:5041339-Pleurochrysis_carterae.AAC.1